MDEFDAFAARHVALILRDRGKDGPEAAFAFAQGIDRDPDAAGRDLAGDTESDCVAKAQGVRGVDVHHHADRAGEGARSGRTAATTPSSVLPLARRVSVSPRERPAAASGETPTRACGRLVSKSSTTGAPAEVTWPGSMCRAAMVPAKGAVISDFAMSMSRRASEASSAAIELSMAARRRRASSSTC